MSKPTENLPDDPAELKAMIAAMQAENAKISATLRVHDQLVQALRLRIAKLQKLAFGKSSEKVEREIEQLELALEDLLVAVAEGDEALIDEGPDEPSPDTADAPALRRRPRVSDATPCERRELDPGSCCPDCGGDPQVVGEDVSELLDMIAAQMKVIQIAGPKNPAAAASGWCRNPHPAARSRAVWRDRTCWPMCWSQSSMITCLCIASTRSSPVWGPTFPKARLSAGAAAS
jgi:transposase